MFDVKKIVSRLDEARKELEAKDEFSVKEVDDLDELKLSLVQLLHEIERTHDAFIGRIDNA